MKNETLSLIMGFFAMAFVMTSYFVRKKQFYLFFQSCCIVFLIASYLFNVQYFATIGLSIGLVRAVTFYLYEKQEKKAPIALAFLFSSLTVMAYIFVNKGIEPLDLLCLSALVMNSFIFRMRDLKTVRYLMLVSTILAIFFNVLTSAAIFVTCSYTFELLADVVSIFKYHILPAKSEKHT